MEHEKRILETQNLLKDLPTTPSWLKKSIQKIHETPAEARNQDFSSPFSAQISKISFNPNATPSFAHITTIVNKSPANNDLDRYLQPTVDLEKTPAPPKSLLSKKDSSKLNFDQNSKPFNK